MILSLSFLLVASEVMSTSKIITPYGLLFAYILFSLRCILEAYGISLATDTSYLELGGTNIFLIIAFVIAFPCCIWWVVKKSRNSDHWSSERVFTDGEYQYYMNITIGIAVCVSAMLCNLLLGATTWSNASEKNLLSYVFIQFAANVLLTGSIELTILNSDYLSTESCLCMRSTTWTNREAESLHQC